jgi:LysR family transcriptional regulator, transcriptional activator of the cysJI operon
MLNLEWFRTFKVIYEAGTLTAAAEALFISQPGVSLHLNSLEAYTGYRLFERDARRVVPTERAIILYNYIVSPMLQLEEIEQLFHRKSRTSKPTISIGMDYTTFQRTLEQHIGQLPFNLIARFGDCSQMIEDLNNGAIDFVLTSQNAPLPNLVYTPFHDQRVVLICGGQTDVTELDDLVRCGNRESVRDWLKQQSWFATSVDMEYLRNFWEVNFSMKPDFKPSYVLPNFGSILQSLKHCSGFAVVPDYLCKDCIKDGYVKLAWEGGPYLENTLHFGRRKKTAYAKELEHLEGLLANNWFA